MDDLGQTVAWRALSRAPRSTTAAARPVGVVERVITAGDIFEGILIHTRPFPGRHLIADHHQVAELHERGVVLAVGRDELREPPPPRRRRHRSSPEPDGRRSCGVPGTGSAGQNP